jgi:uncharacterized protein (TIGR03083 family)
MEGTTMSEALPALHASVGRLREVVGGLEPGQIRQSAYPSEWTVADTLSHLGSGAVILQRRFEDTVAGRPTDDRFSQSVWDEWNAKPPEEQAAEALVADAALLESLESSTDGQRRDFSFVLGPMQLDFEGFVGLRLAEHVVHTWDVEVAVDPAALLDEEAVAVMIDRLGLVAGFAGKPVGLDAEVHVELHRPDRRVTVVLAPDSVRLDDGVPGADADLVLPAEAFIRLVYGRLDPEHTPSGTEGAQLDRLRQAFPGL